MTTIIHAKNPRKPYTVRYVADGHQREKSFTTKREAQAFRDDIDRAARYRPGSAAVLSRKTGEIPVRGTIYAVYRLWGEDGCLYVGQSTQVHPILRVMQHRRKQWWGEVTRADFITVLPESLDQAELDQIWLLQPKYNKVTRRWGMEAAS